MSAPKMAPKVEKKITSQMLRSPAAALYAAGGTTISEGKGINELSMVIKRVMVQ
jgi:uncharacterized protein YjeT (DUF2065 family)